MFEFLYITDTHIRSTAPAGRIDDYFDTCLRKLNKVCELAHENAIPILHGGDFWDRLVDFKTFTRVAELINAYDEVQWYVNAGQHDMDSHSKDSVFRRPLGGLGYLPNFHILPDRTPWSIAPNILVYASWYANDIDRKEFFTINPKETQWKGKADQFVIHMPHGLLVRKPFFGDYALINELPDTRANLVLGSDYHPGWGRRVWQHGDTCFLGPGSLMRPVKTDRIPAIAHVEITPEVEIIDVEFIDVSTEHPFREDDATPEQEHMVVDERYIGIVEKIAAERDALRFAEPRLLVAQLAKETEAPAPVVARALKWLDQADESLV